MPRLSLCLRLVAVVALLATVNSGRQARGDDGWTTLAFPPELWTAPPQHPLPHDLGLLIRGQQGGEEEEDSIETDRPDFTEASSTVPRGVVQLETGYTFTYDDDDAGGRTRTHSGPETLVRYGLTELFELRLFWNYLWEHTSEAGVRSDADGAEDLTVGTKIYLLEQAEWLPETSIIFELSTPTGADAFSSRHVEFGANLLYAWELPCDFSLGASTGYSTGTEVLDPIVAGGPEIEDRHNVFHQSVALGIPLAGRFGGYIEYFGLYFDGLGEGGPEHYVDGGFTYLVNNDLQLDIRAGHGLSDDADDVFGGAGLSVRR